MNAADAIRLAVILDRITELGTTLDVNLTTEVGQRFIRIVQTNEYGNRHVHAFVDIATGDIIKAAGWKAPQKDKGGLAVRGNLLDDVDFARILSIADKYGGYLYKR